MHDCSCCVCCLNFSKYQRLLPDATNKLTVKRVSSEQDQKWRVCHHSLLWIHMHSVSKRCQYENGCQNDKSPSTKIVWCSRLTHVYLALCEWGTEVYIFNVCRTKYLTLSTGAKHTTVQWNATHLMITWLLLHCCVYDKETTCLTWRSITERIVICLPKV